MALAEERAREGDRGAERERERERERVCTSTSELENWRGVRLAR